VLDVVEEFAQDGFGEWGVKEEEAGAGREVELGGVLMDGADRHGGALGAAPEFEVGLGGFDQAGVELDADDFAEGILGGEEEGTSFAAADVDECVVGDRMFGRRANPAIDDGAEAGGGYAQVAGVEEVVGVTSGEVNGGDESAGVDAEVAVERVDHYFRCGFVFAREATQGGARGPQQAAMMQRPTYLGQAGPECIHRLFGRAARSRGW